jgi:hypothetical protein
MLSDRTATGFSGLIVVLTVLLTTQVITGIGAFPL